MVNQNRHIICCPKFIVDLNSCRDLFPVVFVLKAVKSSLPSLIAILVVQFAACELAIAGGRETTAPARGNQSFSSQVINDYHYYYAASSFSRVLVTLGITAVFANTAIDEEIFQEHFRSEFNNSESSELFSSANDFGDYTQLVYAAPLYLGAMWLGNAFGGEGSGDNVITIWGNRSLRTLLLGAPQQLVLSYATGAHRPDEGESNWHPFNDDNGVSGHAFFGAVPLLTAARLTTNNFAKYALYAASTLPGLARVKRNSHYMSQVVLGWSLAYFSSASVFADKSDKKTNIGVYSRDNNVLIGIEIGF